MPSRKHKIGGVWVAESSGGVEVVRAAPDDATLYPIDATYGDEFDAAPISGSWTKRNIAQSETLIPEDVPDSITVPPAGVELTFDAQGDGIWRTAPSGDFEIVVSMVGGWSASQGQMIGPGIIDSSGTGRATSLYPDSSGSIWIWHLTTYNYAASGSSVTGLGLPATAGSEYWISLRKTGTNYKSRRSLDGVNWSAFTGDQAWAGTVDRIGIGRYLAIVGTSTFEVKRFNVYPGPTFFVP